MAKVPNSILRLAWTGRFKEKPCSHLDQINDVQATTGGCEECLELGDKWVHLRMCLTCGHVGCCSSSKHDHALQHFKETGHPMTRPYQQPGMDWFWCYEDKALLDPR